MLCPKCEEKGLDVEMEVLEYVYGDTVISDKAGYLCHKCKYEIDEVVNDCEDDR